MLTNIHFNSSLKKQAKLTSKLLKSRAPKLKLILQIHNIKEFTTKTFKKKHLTTPKTDSLSKTRLFINNSSFNFSEQNDTKGNSHNDEDLKEIESYIPKEALVFKNKKCIIILANSEQKNFIKKVSILNHCFNGLFGYKFFLSIYYSSIIKTIIYLIPFALCVKSSMSLNVNKKLLIQSISL